MPVVVVTGSTGRIGSRLCAALAEDYRVVGLDRDEPEGESAEHWLACDLTEDANVAHAMAEVTRRFGRRIESVVHLAAYYDFSGEPSPLYDELTVEGTRRLLRALDGLEVGQIVFSSSLLVMRPVEVGETIDEGGAVAAEWEYPRSKLDAERVLREERGEIPALALRIAGVYDEDCSSIPIAQQIRRIYEKQFESYFFPGDADHGQSFVHMDDLVRCLCAAVEHRADLAPYEVLLVGEEDTLSYADVQRILGEAVHGVDWPTIEIPAPLAKVGAWVKSKLPGQDPFIQPWMIDLADAHRPVTIDRARSRLGWQPRRSLRETLPEMANRIVSNPHSWYEKNGLEAPENLDELIERRKDEVRERGSRHA